VKLVGGRLRLSASDVANFVACGHLTRLDLLHARGEIQPPRAFDVGFQDLVARGEAHEAAVLARLRADGWQVAEIAQASEADAAAATLAAISSGVDIVFQGVLVAGREGDRPALLGRPDFLVRAGLLPAPDRGAGPAGGHYEVLDVERAVRRPQAGHGSRLGTRILRRINDRDGPVYACGHGIGSVPRGCDFPGVGT
jgi:uncharacterized protein